MTFLTRHTPAFNAAHFHNIDRVLDTFFGDAIERGAQLAGRFAVDVHEDGNAYIVTADLPGVTRDNVHVDIDGAVVTIGVEWKCAAPADDTTAAPKLLRGERKRTTEGRISRSFQLPVEVNSEAADAKLVDGVLELRLPKQLQATAKRLTVQ
jgi:HSP20 family protein